MRSIKSISISEIVSIIMPMVLLVLISFYHLFANQCVMWTTIYNMLHNIFIITLSLTVYLTTNNKQVSNIQRVIIPYFTFKCIYELLYYVDIEWFNFWDWFWSVACVLVIIFCLILVKKHGRIH